MNTTQQYTVCNALYNVYVTSMKSELCYPTIVLLLCNTTTHEYSEQVGLYTAIPHK